MFSCKIFISGLFPFQIIFDSQVLQMVVSCSSTGTTQVEIGDAVKACLASVALPALLKNAYTCMPFLFRLDFPSLTPPHIDFSKKYHHPLWHIHRLTRIYVCVYACIFMSYAEKKMGLGRILQSIRILQIRGGGACLGQIGDP